MSAKCPHCAGSGNLGVLATDVIYFAFLAVVAGVAELADAPDSKSGEG